MFSSSQDHLSQMMEEITSMARMIDNDQFSQQQNVSSYTGYYPPCEASYDQGWMNQPDPNWNNPSNHNYWEPDQWGNHQTFDDGYASHPQEGYWHNPSDQNQWELCHWDNYPPFDRNYPPYQEDDPTQMFSFPAQTQYPQTSYFSSAPQLPEPPIPLPDNTLMQEMMEMIHTNISMMRELQTELDQLKNEKQQTSIMLSKEPLPSSAATQEPYQPEPIVEYEQFLAPVTLPVDATREEKLESNEEKLQNGFDSEENEVIKKYEMMEESVEAELDEPQQLPDMFTNNFVFNAYEHEGIKIPEFQGPQSREENILEGSSFEHSMKDLYVWSNKRPLLPIRRDLYPPPFFDDHRTQITVTVQP